MKPLPTWLDALAQRTQALSAAGSPADTFHELLDGLKLAGPRGAVFLVRRDEARGWGAFGYPPDVEARQRSSRSPIEPQGWLGRLAAAAVPRVERIAPPVADPDFGQSIPSEAAGIGMRAGERPVALLLIERAANETPWYPEALTLLATVARMRLELLLARAQAGAAARAPTVAAAEDPALEVARRFARLVATDIRLYNEQAVLLGQRHRDLAERLAEPLERGRETFRERHGGLGSTGTELLHAALVDVLAGGDSALLPRSVVLP